MLIKNTLERFGIIAIFLHWLMAFLIIGMLILGIYMTDLPISMQKLKLYGWHKELGILILMLAVLRLIWRIKNINPTLSFLPRWERTIARITHLSFYFFMLVMPVTGWLLTSAADLPISFFGLFTIPTLIPADTDQRILFTTIHEWLAYGFIALICLHILAALKHQFIDKDEILERIL